MSSDMKLIMEIWWKIQDQSTKLQMDQLNETLKLKESIEESPEVGREDLEETEAVEERIVPGQDLDDKNVEAIGQIITFLERARDNRDGEQLCNAMGNLGALVSDMLVRGGNESRARACIDRFMETAPSQSDFRIGMDTGSQLEPTSSLWLE